MYEEGLTARLFIIESPKLYHIIPLWTGVSMSIGCISDYWQTIRVSPQPHYFSQKVGKKPYFSDALG
jgi:hypothetical protein